MGGEHRQRRDEGRTRIRLPLILRCGGIVFEIPPTQYIRASCSSVSLATRRSMAATARATISPNLRRGSSHTPYRPNSVRICLWPTSSTSGVPSLGSTGEPPPLQEVGLRQHPSSNPVAAASRDWPHRARDPPADPHPSSTPTPTSSLPRSSAGSQTSPQTQRSQTTSPARYTHTAPRATLDQPPNPRRPLTMSDSPPEEVETISPGIARANAEESDSNASRLLVSR